MANLIRTKSVAQPPATSSSATAALSRPSNAAGDAAAAAEFAEKKYVWIPDKDNGYLAAWVIREEEDGDKSLCSLTDGQQRTLPTFELSKMNPPKFDKAEDIADLTFLNEASVVHNLRQRYFSGLIYTYSGLFLVAVNPYHSLPIYTDAIVAAYKGRRREENAPHVFALADGAMRNMLDARENQSLLITGESGAGKTENTKKVIQYLAAIAADVSLSNGGTSSPHQARDGSSHPGTLTRSGSSRIVMDHLRGVEGVSSKRLGLLERQILQANPILEAFGNAQTIRNNNSSRFGKFVRIEFTSVGSIAGANIDWYLLEKSRVTNRSSNERNFHIFYQLLRSDEKEIKSKLLLSSNPDDYDYLKGSRKDVEGVNDKAEFNDLKEALGVVGFSSEEQFNLFRVIGSILQVGNITLADDRSEQARITNSSQVEKVCHVLGLPEAEFTTALTRPRVKAGREWVTQARTKRQVVDEMAALCKTLYEKTFGHIVERINKALDRPTSKSTFIGVLDIAGFEIFETNSFEQLCINYTNEKLQQFFNHHMFVLEQEEYAREEIEWDFVNFGLDLQPTIDLIESTAPIGILSCLDEECIMPKASDLTFTEKLNRQWGVNKDGTVKDAAGAALAAEKGVAHGSSKYIPARFAQGFTIKHYAGNVEYRTDGWLDKNKDPLNDHLTRVMSESTDRFISTLFAEYAPDDEAVSAAASAGPGVGPPKRRMKRGAFRTGAQRHKEQLTSLMTQLGSTQPHFVRCIVPNPDKKPGKMEVPLVLEQLRCNGVLEGIRIARLGYPNRLLFSEFRNRYEVLTPGIIPQGYMDGRKACQRMVEALELDRATFKIGTSKIFFKAGVLAEMEERRDHHLFDIFSRFQAAARMFTARRQMKKILNRAAAVRTIQHNARLYCQLREWPWWQLYTKMRPLLSATRHDEELKRKELELAMITERAERDQKEREALETLKFSLQSEKKRVEDELEAERTLLADKDQLLARSKERESALEDDLAALQADVDLLDSQLERALASQKQAEANHTELKVAFEAAAEHLVRLEKESNDWKSRETTLTADVGKHSGELERLRAEQSSVAAEKEELGRKLKEKDEDLARMQQRMTAAVAEVEQRLQGEVQAREAEVKKVAKLESQSLQSSQQLSELARSSSDHEAAIKKKDAEVADVVAQLSATRKERDASSKQATDLKVKIDTLTFDLNNFKSDSQRTLEAKGQLQKELDETRRLMDAKSSEDVKQKELHRMKEQELQGLREQMTQLQEQLTQSKHSAAEQANALKAEADSIRKQHAEVSRSHSDVSDKLKQHEFKLVELSAAVAAADKAKRLAEGELQSVKDRASSAEAAVEEAKKFKESTAAELAAAKARLQDQEDACFELERSEASWKHKADQVGVELSAETKRRELLESKSKQHERESGTFQQQLAVKDKEMYAMKSELAAALAETKKMQSMQNKTIVEHVHVLEEAKKYTDRQLLDAQSKLQELAHYTKTLEKSKARLLADNEDLSREVSQLQQQSRSAGKTTSYGNVAPDKKLENKVAELTSQLRDARRERDEAQSNARRKDLQADEAVSRTRQQYEARITELEREIRGVQAARSMTFTNLEEIVKRGDNSADDTFRRRLLSELRSGHDELEQDIAAKSEQLRSHKMNGSTPKKEKPLYTFGNVAPSRAAKSSSSGPSFKQGVSNDNSASKFASEDASRAEKRATGLQMQLDALEVQLSAGQRVRAHLESQVREMTSEMDAQGGSKFSLDAARRKLSADNRRLNELLEDEAEARKSAEISILNGEVSLRREFQERLASLSGAARDEEMRKTMLSQQKIAATELQRAREDLAAAHRARLALESQVSEARQRLDREALARNEEAAEKHRVMMELQELRINSASVSHAVAEARDTSARERARNEDYVSRLQQLDMEKLKAEKTADLTRLTLNDTERALSDSVGERKAAEDHIIALESQLRELQARLNGDGRDWQNVENLRMRLEQEFEGERRRYKADLHAREEAIESSRRRYQQELDNVAGEIEAHRQKNSDMSNENRRLRQAYEELQHHFDESSSTAGGWAREKERLEGKVGDLTRAYTESLQAQRDGQSQTVGLLAQVRDLRAGLDESELKYSQLSAAYTNLCQEAGVDEGMIESLERAVARYRAQADSHLENWRKTTQELEQQTQHLRQATLRRPGSIPPESLGSPSSRASFR